VNVPGDHREAPGTLKGDHQHTERSRDHHDQRHRGWRVALDLEPDPPRHRRDCPDGLRQPRRANVAAKTGQKHDYPSAAWRRSYARRTSSERAFAAIKDTATTSIAPGWCRQAGLTPLMLWIACLLVVRKPAGRRRGPSAAPWAVTALALAPSSCQRMRSPRTLIPTALLTADSVSVRQQYPGADHLVRRHGPTAPANARPAEQAGKGVTGAREPPGAHC